MTNWSVLILCTGHGRETVRSLVFEHVRKLGFDAHVYDKPGYPVDPMVHSHAACIEAIPQHDIVLALADESEGGALQLSEIPDSMLQDLRDRDIVPPSGSNGPSITIFQMEVMMAKSLGKPTIVLIPSSVEAKVEQTLKLLRSGALNVTAKTPSPPELTQFVGNSDWKGLASHYEVPTGHLASFGQIAFLEQLRRESPNFISFYDSNDTIGLVSEITSRLSGVAETLIKRHVLAVEDRVERKRNPVGESSLQDLISLGLIIASPFEVASGRMERPLFSANDQVGNLAGSLTNGKNVLLLGHPGLGKTTASLLAFRDLVKASQPGVSGFAPLYCDWRTLPVTFQFDPAKDASEWATEFIRLMLGLPFARNPWPLSMNLPNRKWLLVLDGLDESTLERNTLVAIIRALAHSAHLLITCRQFNYERYLQVIKSEFNTLVKLTPWDGETITHYSNALLKSGKVRAHEFVSSWLTQNQLPSFISLPLWLSMLTYLAERPIGQTLDASLSHYSVYELLRVCNEAVEDDEVLRHGIDPDDKPTLRKAWGTSAWELHKARREERALSLSELSGGLGIDLISDSPLAEGVMALLDTVGRRVYGFFHEFFHEYWLAEFLGDRLADVHVNPQQIASYFSFQRSVVTNALIRSRIRSLESAPTLVRRLQEAFGAATGLGERALFAQNQIVYLLGRIDQSSFNRDFLGLIWRSSEYPNFVRHSAAFAAVILGDSRIEAEYYDLLSQSTPDDRMNRGYHLHYYGDIDARESAMPVIDDDSSGADAALTQLFRRLNRTETRHLNLRRIELFTIRRFLETGRKIPGDVRSPLEIIAKVVTGSNEHQFSDDYHLGVEHEAAKITVLLSQYT